MRKYSTPLALFLLTVSFLFLVGCSAQKTYTVSEVDQLFAKQNEKIDSISYQLDLRVNQLAKTKADIDVFLPIVAVNNSNCRVVSGKSVNEGASIDCGNDVFVGLIQAVCVDDSGRPGFLEQTGSRYRNGGLFNEQSFVCKDAQSKRYPLTMSGVCCEYLLD